MKKVLALLLVVLLSVSLFGCNSKNKENYEKALTLVKEEKYNEALPLFATLEEQGYEDSAEQVKLCRYNIALSLLNEDKGEEALQEFKELEEQNYKDSDKKVKECINLNAYNRGIAAFENGLFDVATMEFNKIEEPFKYHGEVTSRVKAMKLLTPFIGKHTNGTSYTSTTYKNLYFLGRNYNAEYNSYVGLMGFSIEIKDGFKVTPAIDKDFENIGKECTLEFSADISGTIFHSLGSSPVNETVTFSTIFDVEETTQKDLLFYSSDKATNSKLGLFLSTTSSSSLSLYTSDYTGNSYGAAFIELKEE